jgi:hypothetical protein
MMSDFHPTEAESAYARALKRSEALSDATGCSDLDPEVEKASILGRNILQEEIGQFGPNRGAHYDLDKPTADRLLAHARQDIAGVYSLATDALRHAEKAERLSRQNRLLLVLALLGLVVIGAKLWGLL